MVKIAPSLLAADYLHLSDDLEIVNTYADLFHMDVMDGVFVPNISIGFPIVEAVAGAAVKPLDVHLMIVNPQNYALRFAAIKGVVMVSFHLEACPDPVGLLEKLRQANVKAGLAINPDRNVEELFPYLEHCDFVLLMSVFAGFGGQKFIEGTYDRIRTLKKEISKRCLNVEIEVDGGVSPMNSKELTDSGADILVAGTSVFKSGHPAEVIASMR